MTPRTVFRSLSPGSRMPGTCGVVAMLLALSIAGLSARQAAEPRPATNTAGRVASRSTPHLKFTATISPATVVPGARMSIAVEVVPKPGMHVFAPGTQYRPVAIRLQAGSLLRIHGSTYPKATLYLFKPLKEEVLVYDAPFRLAVAVMAGDADALRAELRDQPQLTVKGALDYQACDDRVCYVPTSVPLQWTLRVARR